MSMGLLLWLQSRWGIRALNWFILNQIIVSLREKCPNTELFLVRILPHSEWIWRDISYLSVFTPSVGKNGPEITPYLDTFHTVHVIRNSNCFIMLKLILIDSLFEWFVNFGMNPCSQMLAIWGSRSFM